MDDVLEFCGDQSARYQSSIVEPLLNGCKDPAPANRQAAAYGIGVAAHKGGAAWAPFLGAALPLLFQITQLPNARGDDDVYATENACAAIAKILQFNASSISDVQQVTTQWVDTLPIIYDEEAAPYAYAYLAVLIEQQNPIVISQAPKVFMYIVQAIEGETLQGNTEKRIVESAKHLLATAGLDPAQLLQQMAPETQEIVRKKF